MLPAVFVGLGGFAGAVIRYGVSAITERYLKGFPIGTLAVNVVGCLVLGGLMALVHERQALSPNARLFLTTGLLGALTTFSAFGYETVELFRLGSLKLATFNIVANVGVGLTGIWAGHLLMTRSTGL